MNLLSKFFTKRNLIDEVDAKLALKSGMALEVFLALRSASIKRDKRFIYLFFYYDGEISDDDYNSADCMATEVISHFPEYDLKLNILRLDYPTPIPKNIGELVYLRWEEKQKIIKPIFKDHPEESLRIRLKLAMIHALLGRITANMRDIGFTYDEKTVTIYFSFDNSASEKEKSLIEEVVKEMQSYFPSFQVNTTSIHCPYPQDYTCIPNIVGIHLRKEKNTYSE